SDGEASPDNLGLFPPCSCQAPDAGKLCRATVGPAGFDPEIPAISFPPFQWSSLSSSSNPRRWKLDPGGQRLVAFCGRHDADLAGGQRLPDHILIGVPEMGPVRGGYNLAHLPNSWEEAIRLKPLLEDVWSELISGPTSA